MALILKVVQSAELQPPSLQLLQTPVWFKSQQQATAMASSNDDFVELCQICFLKYDEENVSGMAPGEKGIAELMEDIPLTMDEWDPEQMVPSWKVKCPDGRCSFGRLRDAVKTSHESRADAVCKLVTHLRWSTRHTDPSGDKHYGSNEDIVAYLLEETDGMTNLEAAITFGTKRVATVATQRLQELQASKGSGSKSGKAKGKGKGKSKDKDNTKGKTNDNDQWQEQDVGNTMALQPQPQRSASQQAALDAVRASSEAFSDSSNALKGAIRMTEQALKTFYELQREQDRAKESFDIAFGLSNASGSTEFNIRKG